jgi:hypothetical protein
MQTKYQKYALAALAALGAVTLTVVAQSPTATPAASPTPGDGPGRGPGGHHRPPPSPLVMALDVNKDGVIDATEIANAAAELKTLDKNGDGQLTPDEFAPPRPPHPPQDGQGGPDDQDGPPPPPQD